MDRARFLPLTVILVGILAGLGCSSPGSDDDDDSSAGVTYYEDVKPIMNESCASCHHPGSIAPFSLETYEDAKLIGAALLAPVQTRTMPPSNVDASGACQQYDEPRWLSDDQIATITDWVNGGMPEGDPANDPGPPQPLPSLPQVDVNLDMGFSYTPSTAQNDDYHCFLVDPGNANDMYITGYDVQPGEPSVVHHVVLYSLDTAQAQADAEAMDQGDGYTCFGASGVSDSRPLLVWAPGTGATQFPAGTGVRLPGGRKAVMQVHYNLLAGLKPDRTTVDLDLEPSVPSEGIIGIVGPTNFSLPPGQESVEVNYSLPLAQLGTNIKLHSIYPHMHKLGKSMLVDRSNTGGNECIADVPDWNFDWQQFFPYQSAITLTPQDTLNITCTYDTTGRTTTTTFGDGTEDEMCFAIVYVSL